MTTSFSFPQPTNWEVSQDAVCDAASSSWFSLVTFVFFRARILPAHTTRALIIGKLGIAKFYLWSVRFCRIWRELFLSTLRESNFSWLLAIKAPILPLADSFWTDRRFLPLLSDCLIRAQHRHFWDFYNVFWFNRTHIGMSQKVRIMRAHIEKRQNIVCWTLSFEVPVLSFVFKKSRFFNEKCLRIALTPRCFDATLSSRSAVLTPLCHDTSLSWRSEI